MKNPRGSGYGQQNKTKKKEKCQNQEEYVFWWVRKGQALTPCDTFDVLDPNIVEVIVCEKLKASDGGGIKAAPARRSQALTPL